MENCLETQLLAEFTLGVRSWRTVFVASREIAPVGIPCSHPECLEKAGMKQEGYRIGFVKLTKIHNLDDALYPELNHPEVIEVKKHLRAVLNNEARPVYLCADCYPHRLHDLLNKP